METRHLIRTMYESGRWLWKQLRERDRECRITLAVADSNGSNEIKTHVRLYQTGVKTDHVWK